MGNIYIAGSFYDTADFDPSPLVTQLISHNFRADIFLAKYNSTGDLIWAKGLGGPNWDYTTDILLEDSSNVYLSGAFWGQVDFDPGPDTSHITGFGSHDGFISKFSSTGGFKFVYRIGSGARDRVSKLLFNNNHDIVAVGSFEALANMNPRTLTSNRLTSAGEADVFILRLDTGGYFISAKQIGGTGTVGVSNAVIDNDTLYLSGPLIAPDYNWLSGNVDFNPNSGVANYSSTGREDSYIAKFDPSDNPIWINQFGGKHQIRIVGFHMISSGNLKLSVGLSDTSIIYSNGIAIDTIVPLNTSSFLIEVDRLGKYQSLKMFNTSLSIYMTSFDEDSKRNLYSTGSFQGKTDFNLTATNNYKIPVGQGDIFVMKNFGVLVTSIITYKDENKSKLKLYPNPTQGKIKVEFSNSDSRAIVTARDLNGRIISTNVVAKSFNTIELDIVGTSGLYFVEVNIDGFRQFIKVLKQ